MCTCACVCMCMCVFVWGLKGLMDVMYYCHACMYMLCAKYGLGQSVDCPAQSMDPQIAQSIYRLTQPQACHTTSFVACVSESANGRTDASFLGICPPSD